MAMGIPTNHTSAVAVAYPEVYCFTENELFFNYGTFRGVLVYIILCVAINMFLG
jgi:hypothetical protein